MFTLTALPPTILGENFAKQIALVPSHLIDDAPPAIPQSLHLFALAARPRDKKIDARLNSNLSLLARGRAGLLDHDPLPRGPARSREPATTTGRRRPGRLA